jgi:hypothetical protein
MHLTFPRPKPAVEYVAISSRGGYQKFSKDGNPIKINGVFHVSANILCFMVASTTEAELGALYHNYQTGIVFCQSLEAMGHKQPKTPVHCDNTTTVGIANNTVK